MLATLHLTLVLGMQSQWSRPLFLTHAGLFLLWQPLWRGENKLSWRSSSFIFGLSLIALWWLNWWLLAFWVASLFALVGGRVFGFQAKWQRLHYLLMMAYLLAIFVLGIAPQLFSQNVPANSLDALMNVALPMLLLAMVLLPRQQARVEATQAIDFIYSLLLFALLMLLLLGTLAFMLLQQIDYVNALLRTLFTIASLLFMLGWLWNPRLGFSGLQTMFSRYLLNVGTPFEVWLQHLAESAQQEQSPYAFMQRATTYLLEMPWISGLKWVSDEGQDTVGEVSPNSIEVADQDLHLTLYCRHNIPPTMRLHIQLLIQLLGHFYHAKRRELRLSEIARLQTIYETGSRLTHDLKNMLQSLFALTSVAQHQSEKSQPILQRQLPVLSRRIELLLTKLKYPERETNEPELPLSVWWEDIRQRHQHQNIEWLSDGAVGDQAIPVTLFDSIADNLIDNACNKRLREPGIHIRVSLTLLTASLARRR